MKSLKFWKKETFEIASYKWRFAERANKELMGNGADSTGNCYYTFNELGFRGDSPRKKGLRLMSVGCGHTEGIMVHNHQTWPHYLSKQFKNGVDLNCGINGRSNDYIARTILSWNDTLNPDFVFIMYTYPHKREFYTIDGTIEPYSKKPWGYFDEEMDGRKEWVGIMSSTNTEEDLMNWYKNHLLITNYLDNKQIPFVWNGTFLKTDYSDSNRFDGNYPYFENNSTYASAIQNEAYAKNLYNYIEQNFEI
jgi:hypothetical protein